MSDVLLVDEPLPLVRRLTLNRPDKRNALNDELRGALFDALREGDASADVSVLGMTGAYTHTTPEFQRREIERAVRLRPESLALVTRSTQGDIHERQ